MFGVASPLAFLRWQREGALGTEQFCDEMRRLTAESWRRSATEHSTEAPAEWLAPGYEVTDWSVVTPDEIIAALRVPPPHFPREALRAAEQAKERLAERLLALVQDTYRSVREGAAPPDNGHIFAMMLLAEFEDPRAFDVIADLFSLPADLCEDIAGDFVTEDLGRILASVCGGQIDPLARIIEDRTCWEYVRGAVLTALSALVQRDQITRAAAVAYLVKLTRETLADERSPVWAEVANVALDLYAEELFPDVRRLIFGTLEQEASRPKTARLLARPG